MTITLKNVTEQKRNLEKAAKLIERLNTLNGQVAEVQGELDKLAQTTGLINMPNDKPKTRKSKAKGSPVETNGFSLQAAVLAALVSGETQDIPTLMEVVKGLGWKSEAEDTRAVFNQAINTLNKAGHITRVARGQYEISKAGEKHLREMIAEAKAKNEVKSAE